MKRRFYGEKRRIKWSGAERIYTGVSCALWANYYKTFLEKLVNVTKLLKRLNKS